MTTKYIKRSDLEPTREGLIGFLKGEGHSDLAWVIAAKLHNSLSAPKKRELSILTRIYRQTFKTNLAQRKMSKRLLVASSGWSREPGLISPGGLFGPMQLH